MMRAIWHVALMGALVAAPAAAFSAESRKPKEIVVVGSRAKNAPAPSIASGKTLTGRAKRGAASRKVIDCEGYAYLGQQLLSATCGSK